MGIRQILGQNAEKKALLFLKNQGLMHLNSNFRVQGGEIDLIMQDGAQVVFVEVRYRKEKSFGGAIESVTSKKQKRLILAARHYLAQFKTLPSCRFDCVFFEGDDPPVWIQNAFFVE